MSDNGSGAKFSGTFTAGSMKIAGRDQVNYGDDTGSIGEVRQELADVEAIRDLLRRVPLTEADRQATTEAVDRLHEEMAKPNPDQPKAAGALKDLTAILTAAGALVGAGIALVDPIGRIAVALGGAAVSVLKEIRKT
jgi:hypothetical protein